LQSSFKGQNKPNSNNQIGSLFPRQAKSRPKNQVGTPIGGSPTLGLKYPIFRAFIGRAASGVLSSGLSMIHVSGMDLKLLVPAEGLEPPTS
ncbi:MAG: hypothetical protein OEL78_00230, partial [Hyphomicrobiales bacterium]|nr:hypothetical protein [Hyphomicrobiales bacterium]